MRTENKGNRKQCEIKHRQITCSLAQAGQWLARKFVQIWKFRARPNGSVSPALRQAAERCASAKRTSLEMAECWVQLKKIKL
jgi:hypothetical protein